MEFSFLLFCVVTMAQGQQAAAQFGGCFSAAGCNAGDVVTALSAEDCCVNTDDGLFYSNGGVCTQCIAFGWTVRTLEGPEEAQSYSVNAGYFKGTGSRTLSASIVFANDSSASLLASAADFESALFASSNRVVMRTTSNASVSITLSVDNVAQEGTETGILRLVLTPGTTQPAGTFFRSDLRVVINDTSTAFIGFNAIEYANNEAEGGPQQSECLTAPRGLAVTVRKTSAIANPVSVRVQPLTIDQALALNLDIPSIQDTDITAINPRVPIRARIGVNSIGRNVTDFSDNSIDITFEADELERDRTQQMTVNIELVDDDIDEADREYFVLYLTLLEATSPDGLLDVFVSVGGIDDNDDTVIGFEMMEYSFNEPAVGQVDTGQTIFLAKQGVTELTYIVLIQRSESTDGLEIDVDYTIGVDRFFGNQILFLADQQRLQLFPDQLDFTIIADSLAEGPETFGLSSAPEGTPTYLRPRTGDIVFPIATITVIDDDNITVGWEQTTYTVSEGAGVVEACYRIFSPTPTESLRDLTFFMLVDTQPGTADESDYVPLSSVDFDMERELSDGTRRACIEVTIVRDNIRENSEEFCVDLLFSEPSDRFFMNSNLTCITIEDNTEAMIGFIGAPYQAREDMGPMVFVVGVIGGAVLERGVVASFSTEDGSTPDRAAVAGSDYIGKSNVTITLNASVSIVEIPVTLIDDNVEGNSNFSAILTLISGERVTVNPDTAMATIEGNEVICEELELLVNGSIEYSSDTTAPYDKGTRARHICNPGFSLLGNMIRVCQNDSNFDGTAPTCNPNCVERLDDPLNGKVTVSEITGPGSIANYTCIAGFSVVGNSTRVCQPDGTWSGDSPSCSLSICEALSDPENGEVSVPGGTTLGSVATYRCNHGYRIEGNDNTLTCTNIPTIDGVWSPQPFPTCIQISCDNLDPPSNGLVTLTNETLFESIASYTCDPLYSIVGNSSRVCQADGTWSNNEPRCDLDNVEAIIGAVVAVTVVLLLLVVTAIVLCVCCLSKRIKQLPTLAEDSSIFVKASLKRNTQEQDNFYQYGTQGMVEQIPQSLRIPRSHLKMSATTLGQGQFGIVYKGLLTNWNNIPLQGVAVKALKGLFSLGDVQSMVNEIIKMQEFKHPHVLSLIGVCLDTGPGISMVMPYMTNGSLLDYLKKERSSLEIQDSDPDKTLTARRLLLRMCHQIALGMEYLTEQKFIHRDLAARNCMLDSNGSVKVGDFGLAEDVYSCGYFREDNKETVLLPYKWMALESLCDSIFSEKTDVWSYGVTMWEVFCGGRNPYPGVDPMTLTQLLRNGRRLDPPETTACSAEIFAVMTRCWCEDPEERPHFSELCSIMDHLLTQISDYVELSMVLVEGELDINEAEYDIVAEEESLKEESLKETSI